jgi:hemoglobin
VYDQIGGEPVVRRLVDTFYDAMDTLPGAQRIRAMHPASLDGSRDRFFWYLSGWLGGPPLYVEKRGHPMLRRRHLPFPIDQAAADAWMVCMFHALDATIEDGSLRAFLEQRLGEVAAHMINRA